jgi:6-phosphofructokinase 1
VDAPTIAVLTSGGDAPGMNAAVRAVVRRTLFEGGRVVGVLRGFAGLVEGDYQVLQESSVGDIIQRGGTILQTARYAPFAEDPAVRAEAVRRLRQEGVTAVVVIGGDGSLRGAHALDEAGVPTVGIPASIDHDIAGTDESIGFDTALNTILEAVDRIRDTASAHNRIFVIEVMGRGCGRLALAAGFASGSESALVPEVAVDVVEVAQRILQRHRRGKRHHLVIVAEGAGMGVYEVAERLAQETGLETRVTVLGHLQRGGNPSAVDRILASRLGAAAVEALCRGTHDALIGIRGGEVVAVPLAEVTSAPRAALDRELYRLMGSLSI